MGLQNYFVELLLGYKLFLSGVSALVPHAGRHNQPNLQAILRGHGHQYAAHYDVGGLPGSLKAPKMLSRSMSRSECRLCQKAGQMGQEHNAPDL